MNSKNINKKELLEFIHKAHQNTYAASKEIKKQYNVDPILPDHKDYDFKEEEWRYHDSYAGWFWPPGKEIIFYREKTVWCMSYQGKALSENKIFVEEIYAFLKRALLHVNKSNPFRGPKKYTEKEFTYTFNYEGNYEYFIGREQITHKKKEVFFQDVMGSLIK